MKSMSSVTQQKGVSLLEVLISVVVLGVGILGVVGLQSVSLRSTNTAHERAMAVILTETLFEVMRSTGSIGRTNAFVMDDCEGVGGIPVTKSWQDDVKQVTAECAVVVWNDGVYTVTIDWTDQRLNASSIVVMEARP
ncbi:MULTISPECIES: type IV pilus modification protein PilV [Alkalimonas]|uniref:Type IV pilus modification protein PilV n=1 Tax=Alkalimonas mucilaginosa TaxID=3057676 RepID=A0ABU7JHQ8_9GAMM|nr:type IV pilus modification protein PilV [Alkalimonas sp. MEB004]MEE2024655.1 type IV pilus modification protein PilV [Alkalimonas sp. MEB004]